MPSWIGWLLAFVKGFLGIKADIAEQNAETTGETKQALKDQGAAYADVQSDAAAASAADQRIVQQQPGADRVVPAADLTGNPDLPQR